MCCRVVYGRQKATLTSCAHTEADIQDKSGWVLLNPCHEIGLNHWLSLQKMTIRRNNLYIKVSVAEQLT